MEFTLSEDRILTSCRNFLSYLVGEVLMELTYLRAAYGPRAG